MGAKHTIPLFSAGYADNDELLTIKTNTKKSHYTCTEAKLYDSLVTAIRTSGSYFNLLLSTCPTIAVHINGRSDLLEEHKEWLLKQVTDTLKFCHVQRSQ